VQVQIKRLLQQQPYGSGTAHAITTPEVKALLQVGGETYMGWMAKAHDAGRGTCTL